MVCSASAFPKLRLGCVSVYCYKESVWFLACMHLCHVLSLLCFVSPSLQYCYKRKRLIARTCWLCFVSPSLQCCYKRKRLIARMHLSHVLCFVSPSLQYWQCKDQGNMQLRNRWLCYVEKREYQAGFSIHISNYRSRMLLHWQGLGLQKNARFTWAIRHFLQGWAYETQPTRKTQEAC